MAERHLLPAKRATLGFASRLRAARDARELTQVELAKKLKCSDRSIYMLEANERSPSMDFLKDIAVALGCTTDYLCGLKDWEG